MSAIIAALLGTGVGLGLLAIAHGWRGASPYLARLRGGRGVVVRACGVGVVGVVAGVATGWLAGAVLAGLACWAVARVVRSGSEQKLRLARIEAIATWTEMLRDTLAAASGLEQAILSTAPLAPDPIRDHVSALALHLEDGERLAPALHRLADQLADSTSDLVIAALVKASEQHARRLSDLLGALAETAREQVAMRLRVEAGRARIRTAVRVVVGTTLVFAVGVVLLNRNYLSAYDSITGQLVLLGIGALFATGFFWLNRIARVPEPARFFSANWQV